MVIPAELLKAAWNYLDEHEGSVSFHFSACRDDSDKLIAHRRAIIAPSIMHVNKYHRTLCKLQSLILQMGAH